jgi:hypothetical protein
LFAVGNSPTQKVVVTMFVFHGKVRGEFETTECVFVVGAKTMAVTLSGFPGGFTACCA